MSTFVTFSSIYEVTHQSEKCPSSTVLQSPKICCTTKNKTVPEVEFDLYKPKWDLLFQFQDTFDQTYLLRWMEIHWSKLQLNVFLYVPGQKWSAEKKIEIKINHITL